MSNTRRLSVRAHASVLTTLSALVLCFANAAQAEIGDLRSLSREVRYALSSHGRALTPRERFVVRRDLAMTIITLQRTTGRRAHAGYSLVGLATTTQRLLDLSSDKELRPSTQRQIERRLSRTADLLERKILTQTD
jgi:hypothetical protein